MQLPYLLALPPRESSFARARVVIEEKRASAVTTGRGRTEVIRDQTWSCRNQGMIATDHCCHGLGPRCSAVDNALRVSFDHSWSQLLVCILKVFCPESEFRLWCVFVRSLGWVDRCKRVISPADLMNNEFQVCQKCFQMYANVMCWKRTVWVSHERRSWQFRPLEAHLPVFRSSDADCPVLSLRSMLDGEERRGRSHECLVGNLNDLWSLVCRVT